MAYFADLTQYEYRPFHKQSRAGLLNVGWLDHEHDYPKGPVDSGSLEKLARLCASPVNTTRGVHHCPYCKEYPVRAITAEVEHSGSVMPRSVSRDSMGSNMPHLPLFITTSTSTGIGHRRSSWKRCEGSNACRWTDS
jgi:hypothetical protein